MKADELFINGWYNHNGQWNEAEHNGPFQWSQKDWYLEAECLLFLEDVSPIPLSPDWMEKAGFEENDNLSGGTSYDEEKRMYYSGPINLCEVNGKFYRWVDIEDQYYSYRSDKPIDYVHQLQLITFALTGTHLTFDKK